MQEIILAISFVVVAAASYMDIRTREVPDWLNYSLLAFGFGANLILSIALETWTYLVYSLAGFGVFFLISLIMFYTGQWGGGDSKLLMALGANMGLPIGLSAPYFALNSFIVSFWSNLLISGVLYALILSIFIAFKNGKKFGKEFERQIKVKKLMLRIALLISVLLLLLSFFVNMDGIGMLMAVTATIVVISAYGIVFSKAVEQAGMIRYVPASSLTEGDWIAKDVIVDGKKLASPKDLGVTKKQMKLFSELEAKGKLSKVLIKVGIPFVPSFLMAFIATLFWGNLLMQITNIL